MRPRTRRTAQRGSVMIEFALSTILLFSLATGIFGFGYAIMLRNLLGHFDASVDLVPVQNYTAGKINAYDATFYLGSYYDNQVPAAFLTDASTTTKTLEEDNYAVIFSQKGLMAGLGIQGTKIDK